MNKWSLRLGKIAGIDFFIHWTFFILIGGMALYQLAGGAKPLEVAQNTALILSVFGCVALHELGHAFAARRYGIRTRDITLLPIGGLARLERMPEKPFQELVVAVAGPAVNVVIAGVLFTFLLLTGGLNQFADVSVVADSFFIQLMFINVGLVLFNMVPAFPMDGGRVLRSILAMFASYSAATTIAGRIGQVVAVGFFLLALTVGHPMLFLIGGFVMLAAQAEIRQAQARSWLHGAPARAAMETRFRVLSPDDSIYQAAEALWTSSQPDFPVIDGDRLVGLASRERLYRALQDTKSPFTVGEIMQRDIPVIFDYEPLDAAPSKLQEKECSTLVVIGNGEMVGLLTTECLSRFVSLRTAWASRPAAPPTWQVPAPVPKPSGEVSGSFAR